MSGGAEDTSPVKEALDDWRGVGLLSLAWSCAFATITVAIATISLAAQPLISETAVTTLPLTCIFYFQGLANLTLPFEVHKFGRRGAYLLGAAVGILGCGFCTISMYADSFALLCIGGSLLGVAMAHAQNYRFAAILLAPSNPPQAISCALAGGVVGAVLGPGGLARARHLFATDFVGVFVLCMGMHGIAMCVLCFVKFPSAAVASKSGVEPELPPRSLAQLFAQPRCWVATFAVLMAYVIMMLVMAPTPLVMREDFGHSYDEATVVMGLHMVLMFAPSPVTGALVRRLGPAPVMYAGAVVLLLSGTALLAGTSLGWFFLGLGPLGVGWNMLFVAGTAQLAGSYRPAEAVKVQALSDSLVFIASGSSSLAAVSVVEVIGWEVTQVVVIVGAVVTAVVAAVPPVLEACGKRR